MRATLAIFLLLTTAAIADPRQSMLDGINRCRSFADDRLFLDCVYGAAQPVRAELGLSPASADQQRLVPPMTGAAAPMPRPVAAAPASPPSHGGFSLFGDTLTMASYSFDKRGLFTVTLSDGSVWKQDGSDTNFAQFGGNASRYPVSITTSDTGRSHMTVRGEGGPYLVSRVR